MNLSTLTAAQIETVRTTATRQGHARILKACGQAQEGDANAVEFVSLVRDALSAGHRYNCRDAEDYADGALMAFYSVD
jgi:hypothetical protein